MLILRRLVIIFCAVIIWVNYELLLSIPSLWWLWALIIMLTVIFNLAQLNKWKFDFEWLGFLAAPLIFSLGTFAFLFFFEQPILRQIILVLSALAYWLYVDHVFRFFYYQIKYQAYALENISSYLNLIASFFIYSTVFCLQLIGIFRLRYLILIVLLVTLIITLQTLWINKIYLAGKLWLAFMFSFCFAELFWALHYWPISYLVNGLCMALCLYASLNIFRSYFQASLNRKLVWRYVLISGCLILISLITAQWA